MYHNIIAVLEIVIALIVVVLVVQVVVHLTHQSEKLYPATDRPHNLLVIELTVLLKMLKELVLVIVVIILII